MEHQVCFLYRTGQDVWYMHKTKNVPKHARISEIKIHITDMGASPSDYMSPTIEYLICDNWYKENELWDSKDNFWAWHDNHACYIKNIELPGDTALWLEDIHDDGGIKVKVLGLFERINNKHPWKRMNVAEIFYINKDGYGRFQYVPYEDIEIINEKNTITEDKFQLFKIYGQHYIEDSIYNFVNYDGIKF